MISVNKELRSKIAANLKTALTDRERYYLKQWLRSDARQSKKRKTSFDQSREMLFKSLREEQVYNLLSEIFPLNVIKKEYYCMYKDVKLYFDYFIKSYNLLFEIQGRQHFEFVKHFHETKEGFTAQKRRDNLKKEYCEQKNLVLVEINYNDNLRTKDDLLKKISSAIGVVS